MRRAALVVALGLLGCGESVTQPEKLTPPTDFALIQVDDGTNSFRPVAQNRPETGSVWSSLAQSFTAEDPTVLFAFKLKDEGGVSNTDLTAVYQLFEGENSYDQLLATRSVAVSTDGVPDGGDIGFVDADFSDVVLVPGQKYTVVATVPAADLPGPGERAGFGIWTSLSNPYEGGRFFFPVGYNNAYFALQDMLFRVTPIPLADAVQSYLDALLRDGSVPWGTWRSLTSQLNYALRLEAGGNTVASVRMREALIRRVAPLVQAGFLTADEGQRLTALLEALRDALPQGGA